MIRRLTRTRALVAASLLAVIAVQIHSFYLNVPPPKDALYAPHPYFFVVLFALQLALQVGWFLQMFGRRHGGRREWRGPALLSGEDAYEEPPEFVERERSRQLEEEDDTDACEPAQMAYAPIYALCNLFIVGASVAWNAHHLLLSHIFTVLNTGGQLYFVLVTLEDFSGKYLWTSENRLTHLVAKTNAGFAVVYMWRTWGALRIGVSRPLIQQQVYCGVFFLLLAFASGPDPTLGVCLLVDLAALAAGSATEEWRIAYACITGILLVVIISDSVLAWRDRKAGKSRAGTHTQTQNLDDRVFWEERRDGTGATYYDHEQIYLSDFRTPTGSEFELVTPEVGAGEGESHAPAATETI